MRPEEAMNETAVPATLRPMAAGVRVVDVNLAYGDNPVLKNVSIGIEPGEFFAFLGPSGSGKTTLLRVIAGFAQPDTGSVFVGDEDITDLPPWKRDVGMVFQSYALWPHMTVRRNVAFGLEERNVPRAEIPDRVAKALDLVGLRHLADRRPSQLSGGQQQRVAVARTIVVRPKVLLLDEPLSNLDAKLRIQVRRELRDLQQRLGLTAIFVTHDQEEANTICDRIAVMNDGIIQQVGSPMELYRQPKNLFVANFLGTANIVEGRVLAEGASRVFEVNGGIFLPIPAAVTVPPDAKLVFRPQDTTIGPAAGEASAVPGKVVHREFLGSVVRYGLRVGESEVIVDAPFRTGDTLHEPDAAVSVYIPLGSALWLSA
jgi:iron(III) transport system ATP-binding protein